MSEEIVKRLEAIKKKPWECETKGTQPQLYDVADYLKIKIPKKANKETLCEEILKKEGLNYSEQVKLQKRKNESKKGLPKPSVLPSTKFFISDKPKLSSRTISNEYRKILLGEYLYSQCGKGKQINKD